MEVNVLLLNKTKGINIKVKNKFTIENETLLKCKVYENIVIIPNGVVSIGEGVFENSVLVLRCRNKVATLAI